MAARLYAYVCSVARMVHIPVQVSSPLKRAGICNMHLRAWRRESAGAYVSRERPGSPEKRDVTFA